MVRNLSPISIGVAGWLLIPAHHGKPLAQTRPNRAPVQPTPPMLDGTYQINIYPSQATYRGKAPPWTPPDNTTIHWWWAFHSGCMPTGCAAHAAKVDKDDHQRFDAGNFTDDLTFVGNVWRDATPATYKVDCGNGKSETGSASWQFEPQPDGTLRGTITHTVTSDGCGNLGNTATEPLSATRIGDAPPGLPAPTAVSSPAPPPDVPVLPVQTVSSEDEELLAELADHGVVPAEIHAGTATGAAGEIDAAHTVCAMRGKGVSSADLVADIADPKGLGLSREQANWLVRLAIQTYCPQYGD